MVFNSTSYVCEGFADPAPAESPTIPTSSYSVCYPLTTPQIGFARFKAVMFWLLYIIMSGCGVYIVVKTIGGNPVLLSIAMAITLIMCILLLVGGVFMTQFAFNGSNKTCLIPTATPNAKQEKTDEYCYNLNDAELSFAKMSVVFGWIYTFAFIISTGLFIWQAN
jgi:hypothetical protein